MIALLIPVLAMVAGVAIHLLRRPADRDRAGVSEAVTAWFLFSFVGLVGVYAFLGHAFLADEIADSIGFPAGNPFQFEVAVANLSFGVLGLMCVRWRGSFWWAVTIGYAVLLWGAAYGHIYQLVVNDNHAPGNSGFVLWADIATPIVAFGLLIYNEWFASRRAADERRPRRHLRSVA